MTNPSRVSPVAASPTIYTAKRKTAAIGAAVSIKSEIRACQKLLVHGEVKDPLESQLFGSAAIGQ